jgi:hypothetical protein
MAVIPASANAAATRQAMRMRSAYWTPASPVRASGVGVAVAGHCPVAARDDQALHLVAIDMRRGPEPLREQARCRVFPAQALPQMIQISAA